MTERKARYRLGGMEYALEANDNENNLHSGAHGFHNVIWEAKLEEGRNDRITFTYLSKDMEQGFPGNMEATVVYTPVSSKKAIPTGMIEAACGTGSV